MDMMSLLSMLNAFWWIKNKLIQLGINPQDLQWVNFNDPASLNQLAAKIMPNLLKSRPDIAQQIKQQAPSFVPDKWAEIIEMIGN
jgi:hypothetical protein